MARFDQGTAVPHMQRASLLSCFQGEPMMLTVLGLAARLGKNSQLVFRIDVRFVFMTNHTFKSGVSRDQASFLPPCVEDYVACDSIVRAIDVFVDSLALGKLGFKVPKL